MTWRLLLSPAAPGPDNMALDEALLERARSTGEWTLRVYGWSTPTLSFGRNQSACGGYDLELLQRRGVAVVRRPTGGRAILHHHEVTYSVTGPIDAHGASAASGLRESYAGINRLVVEGLRALGVEARIVEASARSRGAGSDVPGLLPCFHHPSPGEIVHGARKLVGSAQWRCEGALLQHGSILVDNDQMHISSFLIDGGATTAPLPPPATLREALGRTPSSLEVAHALFGAVRSIMDSTAEELQIGGELRQALSRLRKHYLDGAWTWRR